MAEQLNQTKSGETIYLDFSPSSMLIAQFKAKARGSLNIVWIIDWLENIPRLGLGLFDLVVSTGVLHHLKHVQRGIQRLNEIQIDQGGAAFMVYATYGRTGIYQLQHLLRKINYDSPGMEAELISAQIILNVLPQYHWFKHVKVTDIKNKEGTYDLLCHKRDTSFSVPGLYEWIERGGYNVVDFSLPENRIQVSLRNKINEKLMFIKLTRLKIQKQQAVGELISGNILKQDVYVSKQRNSEATLNIDDKNVIFIYGSPRGFRRTLSNRKNHRQFRNETFISVQLARTTIDEDRIDTKSLPTANHHINIGEVVWPVTMFNDFVIVSLTKKPNRPKTLLSLIADYKEESKSNLTIEEGIAMFTSLYPYIKETGVFLVRHKSISPFPLTCCENRFSVIERSA